MATVRKRGHSWQAQVRREGYPPLSRSFPTKAEAVSWGREQEHNIDRGHLPVGNRAAKGLTLGDLLRRYEAQVTPKKRSSRSEQSRIKTLLAHPMAQVAVTRVTPDMVASYRDLRLQVVSGDTVRRELGILRHCLEVARKEWGTPILINPVHSIAFPEPSKAREQRLEPEAAKRLAEALKRTRAWYLRPLVSLAVETGMRRGELLSLRWCHVNLSNRTAYLETTKNGHSRTIPLTPGAVAELSGLPRTDDRVFPVAANAAWLAWDRLRTRAGLSELRFHDLRHEAVSRFFEMGLSVPEVSLISGHRDTRMLLRYTHLKPEVIASKFRQSNPPF